MYKLILYIFLRQNIGFFVFYPLFGSRQKLTFGSIDTDTTRIEPVEIYFLKFSSQLNGRDHIITYLSKARKHQNRNYVGMFVD